MNKFSIRKATASDKDDVITINGNVYDGRDYLPEYFDDFIACPLTTAYVAIMDNKIVGFVATSKVDGGETVVTRAGRMSPYFSGRGLYKQLKQHALISSGVHQHAFTAVDANPETQKGSFQNINKLIIIRPFVRFLFDARPLDFNVTTRVLNTPDQEDFQTYLTVGSFRSYLFPKDRVILDWVPYRAISANIPLFGWPAKRTKMCSDISTCANGHSKGLLTFCTTFPCINPPYASNIEIYGLDSTSLKDHVICHLRHIRDVTDGVISLLVFVDEGFDKKEVEKVFRDIGLEKNDWYDSERPDRKYSEQYLFERDI